VQRCEKHLPGIRLVSQAHQRQRQAQQLLLQKAGNLQCRLPMPAAGQGVCLLLAQDTPAVLQGAQLLQQQAVAPAADALLSRLLARLTAQGLLLHLRWGQCLRVGWSRRRCLWQVFDC
jgi:hypothetical protein